MPPLHHPRRYWDNAAVEFLDQNRHSLWRQQSDRVNLKLLQDWLPDRRLDSLLKTDLFDEAADQGLLPSLASRAHRLVGADISLQVLAAARARYPQAAFLCADLRELPFGRVFDCVVSNSSLDHFESPEELSASVAELHRVLRPGGLLVLTLDNLQNPLIRLRNAAPAGWLQRLGLIPYRMGVTCGRRGLRDVVERAGFEVLETTAILHFPRVLLAALGSAFQPRMRLRNALLDGALWFERLRRSPVCYFTGHFVAIKAWRPGP